MRKIFLIATLLVAGMASASNSSSKYKGNKMLKTKKVKKSSKQSCVRLYYIADCIQATTCINDYSPEKAEKWFNAIEQNYCSN